MEQKKKYEDLGWELTTEATTRAKTPATPKKRKGSEESGAGEETPAKAKKLRAKKGAESEEKAQDDGEEGADVKEGVKEEEEVDEAV